MAIGEELRSGRFWRGVLAELAATLIFVGVVLGASAAPEPLAPALAGGLAAGGLVCTLGGAQANPALTLALLCTRKLGALRGAAGLVAQCAGATLASAAARAALRDDAGLVTRVRAEGTAGTALAWEAFATFQLALAAFAAAEHAAPRAGLALGSAVAAGALAAGPFSGGSMNPARSLGPAVVTGVWDDHWLSLARALGYLLAQVLGMLAGAGVLYGVTPGPVRGTLGLSALHPGVGPGQGTVVELLLTAQFVLCVFASFDDRHDGRPAMAAVPVGFSLALGHLFGIHYTGASMNPARSFAPAVITRNFANHWVYWAGPLLGAALGAVLYEFALCPRPRSLAERLAALKGEPPAPTAVTAAVAAAEPPPEPPAEPLELKTQGL
ncbi:lens fiber major intrinsic protein-like isoform X1 [Passer domesticus]|uniref:lens fiber major intrinsic protein-like isoform X1 n=1 Tax=Passer domesticus TaxID=48849 RepID=UPI0030FE8F16